MNVEALKPMLFNPVLLCLVLVLYISSICALLCCGFDKKVPANYILLCVFTVCVSWIVGVACVNVKDQMLVFEAAALTAGVVIGITAYAATTKSDFTIFGPILFILGFVFGIASIFCIFAGPTMNLAFASIGVILFSFYLLVDTQMIIGGQNRRYKIDEDSYILASVALYLDIINIFLYILKILNGR